MVAGKIPLPFEGLRLLARVFTLLLQSLHLMVLFGCCRGVWCARLERCRAFLPVPWVVQTVQRAEFWGAIVAMQARHLGID